MRRVLKFILMVLCFLVVCGGGGALITALIYSAFGTETAVRIMALLISGAYGWFAGISFVAPFDEWLDEKLGL